MRVRVVEVGVTDADGSCAYDVCGEDKLHAIVGAGCLEVYVGVLGCEFYVTVDKVGTSIGEPWEWSSAFALWPRAASPKVMAKSIFIFYLKQGTDRSVG
jgi:hypothetical protein